MKTSKKIMVYVIVGLMVMSVLALSVSAIVVLSNNDDDVVVDSTPAGTIDLESNDVNNQEGEEVVSSVVDGVEWPITLDEALSELVIEDIVEGTGEVAKEGDTVTVNYRLAQADGTPVPGNDTFQSGQAFTSPLAQLIAAWQQGIPGMKEGGLRRLKVPSSLAYNDGDLVFDVELLSIGQ